MENEIWKPVVGYEGLYEVSNFGRVKSIHRYHCNNEIIMKTSYRVRGGYECVILCKNNKKKSKRVHRLVAEAFIPNPSGLPIINHKDENPRNNRVSNLEWCDYQYNYYYTYNRHPELKEKMASYFKDGNGKNVSPWSKKGNPHTCKCKVARVNQKWEILEIYESAAETAKIFNVSVSNLITGCKRNKNREKIHTTDGNIFVFIEE
jgi:hypothetical protein